MNNLLIGSVMTFANLFQPTVQAYMEWVNKEKQKDGLSFEPT